MNTRQRTLTLNQLDNVNVWRVGEKVMRVDMRETRANVAETVERERQSTDTDNDAWSLRLPNLRSCFLPDEGFALVEGDLARADAQVIAWESNAHDLKQQLRDDVDIHSDNADMLYAHVWEGRRLRRVRDLNPRDMHSNGMSYRDCAKRWVHATNFAGKARTVSQVMVCPTPHVEQCQTWWLEERHPEIGQLHRKIDYDLRSRKNPVIHNRFGFRRGYVGGDRQSNLIGQALAWIAQSTVAIVINTALRQLDPDGLCNIIDCGDFPSWGSRELAVPEFDYLLQVHDSILGQVRLDALDDTLIRRVDAALAVVVPYDDPLIIAREIKWSAKNWGQMEKWKYGETRIAA